MSLGFGIVGLGMIAEFHARAIQAMEGATLVACCSRNREKADRFGEKFGCRGYEAIEAFLDDPDLEVVSICTPSGYHLEPSLAAAKAGKHLVVEKPLEISLERCDNIIEACEKAGVTLAGVFPSRFHEISKIIKEALDKGRFGRLVLGDATCKWFRSQQYYDEGGWKGTWRLDGGGALMNQSIHAIDLLQWFMGTVECVQAFTGTLGHERIEVEDNAVATLRFANGALGVIEGSTAIYPGFKKRIDICGSAGSAVMEEESLTTWSFVEESAEDQEIRRRFSVSTETEGGAADPAAIGFHGHQKQFEDLVAAIESGRKPLVDGLEARKAVEIILAIYQSAREEKPVSLPVQEK